MVEKNQAHIRFLRQFVEENAGGALRLRHLAAVGHAATDVHCQDGSEWFAARGLLYFQLRDGTAVLAQDDFILGQVVDQDAVLESLDSELNLNKQLAVARNPANRVTFAALQLNLVNVRIPVVVRPGG